MDSLIKQRGVRQFVKFAIVGASSTVIDWGFYLVLTRLFGAFYIIAKVFSFLIAVCNSYFFNRRWTFRSQNKERFSEFSRFLVVSTIGMGLNTLIMFIAVDRLKLFDIYGLIIATATVVFWNFSANKLYTFRESKK